MVKHTQTIRRQFAHFVKLALKGLKKDSFWKGGYWNETASWTTCNFTALFQIIEDVKPLPKYFWAMLIWMF